MQGHLHSGTPRVDRPRMPAIKVVSEAGTEQPPDELRELKRLRNEGTHVEITTKSSGTVYSGRIAWHDLYMVAVVDASGLQTMIYKTEIEALQFRTGVAQ